MFGVLEGGPCDGEHVQIDANDFPAEIGVGSAQHLYKLAGVAGVPDAVALYEYAPPLTGTPLDNPADIFRRFTVEEARHLRNFSEGARRLERMRFFAEVPTQASQSYTDGGIVADMNEPDDEALRAALTELRQLYAQGEPHNLPSVLDILKRSAFERDAPAKDEALEALEWLKKNGKNAVKHGIGLALVVETPTDTHHATPSAILDAYFNGHYFHKDEAKASLAARLDDIAPWGRYTFYSVLYSLRVVYSAAADVIEQALREHSLQAPPQGNPEGEP